MKNKIKSIEYDHEKKKIILTVKDKIPATGYGAKKLIRMLLNWL